MTKILCMLFVLTLLCGCDSGVQWREGRYEVLWIDTGENRILALSLGNGDSIGRVESEVIAVGSNKKYVVAKQRSVGTNTVAFFYIDKSKDSSYLNQNEITQGPFSEPQFNQLSKELGLPGFTKQF